MPFPPLSLSPNAVAANEAKMQLISGGGELRAVVIKSRYIQAEYIHSSTSHNRKTSVIICCRARTTGPELGAASVRRFIGGFLAARTNVTLNK